MEISNSTVDKAGESSAEPQGSDESTGCENIKNIIADKIHYVAGALSEKAADQDAQCGIAQYVKHASEWLDQSAEYVRQFDYKQVDARVREYVRQSPGRSLLIAGVVGLMIGAIWRRR